MWSLKEDNQDLKPLVFSNKKTQEDVVNEVVSEIKKGEKIIFIHGKCGTGKSSIALNIAKELGRASIVVPIKNLQRQYESDYMHKKSLIKSNNQKLKISMITGRKNHICPYLIENKEQIMQRQEAKKEINANLHDIFTNSSATTNTMSERRINPDESCDNPLLPCKIEIKNKNIPTLKKYYQENPEKTSSKENSKSELDLKTIRRMAIAPACPYWNPILNSELKIKNEWRKKEYKSISGKHTIYLRKEGCPYYRQFEAYADADVIIFNSDSYILETAIGRKPLTDVEIIDECDEFLDSFALEGTINLTRLKNELNSIFYADESQKKLADSLMEDIVGILIEANKYTDEKDNILELKKSKALEIIKALSQTDLLEIMSEDSYLEYCIENARKFYEIQDETYINYYKDTNKIRGKDDVYLKLVTINLDKLLGAMIQKNKAFVFMSGTIHSKRVLEEVFGLKNFKEIDAETLNQGTITRLKTGLEKDFKFENFKQGRTTRKEYLKALDKCVEIAKIPIVVQVNAFQDLPNENEISEFELKNLISSQQLIDDQKNDKEGKLVKDFKAGKIKILFTTRCSRGIDFPFETCNSVVITKFPYPNTQSLFWKILKDQRPNIFWDFYKDKAHRELLQRIYRSLRHKDDKVFLLSPDIRVLESKVV